MTQAAFRTPPVNDRGMTKSELICPAGTPAGLRTAVDAGADAIYCGFRGPSNARNFPGLNFTPQEMEQAIDYAHQRGAMVFTAINSFPRAGEMDVWKQAVDDSVRFGADAIIVADLGVAAYAADKHPDQRLHLSVQAGASCPDSIRFHCEAFNIKRVVLPRILTVAEIKDIHDNIPCEIEAFIFGNIGMMAEGRCSLSSYITGQSTNMDGVCSPASAVSYEPQADGDVTARLGGFMVDCIGCDQSTGYPVPCKGRYSADSRENYYAFEEPVSLNLTRLLPDLMAAGVTSFKIEGRQRSRAYVRAVVNAFRRAIDDYYDGREHDITDLLALTEGQRETQGAFESKTWR